MPTQLKINMITVNRILLPGEVSTVVRQSDGLGTDGTNYLIVQMQAGTVIQNTGIEAAGEIFEGQQLTPAFDLVDFQIAVKQGS